MSVDGGGVGVPNTNPAMPAVRPRSQRRESRRERARMPSGFSSIRDILSFIAGLAIISNEVFLSDKVEVAILTVGVALAGLPVVFGADEKRRPPADGAKP